MLGTIVGLGVPVTSLCGIPIHFFLRESLVET